MLSFPCTGLGLPLLLLPPLRAERQNPLTSLADSVNTATVHPPTGESRRVVTAFTLACLLIGSIELEQHLVLERSSLQHGRPRREFKVLLFCFVRKVG
ncbi:hypothetical protein C8R45DRAFT_208442 [Mycena sanguinolenta]|nr:hypothetical protein C8R45DRAFT_208442 [Mycena sanguinolenta]